MESLVIPTGLNGPPGSANGGIAAGMLAGFVAGPGAVNVRLRQPPPLGVSLRVARQDDGVQLLHDDVLIAEAKPWALEEGDPPPCVDVDVARRASAGFRGLEQHPYPTCFVCGVDRHDGLSLRPGPIVDLDDHVATTWVPGAALADGSGVVRSEVVWAALDCPGGWAVDVPGRPMVLGTMQAEIFSRPPAGDTYVLVGRASGGDGRKHFTASALYDLRGRMYAASQATWIEVPPTSGTTTRGEEMP